MATGYRMHIRSFVVDELMKHIESQFPDGWSWYEPDMGMDSLLECPHGSVIEQDGRCPSGCVSPLRRMGLI